jgi:myo-inositol-1(or 4)-monophosphatase
MNNTFSPQLNTAVNAALLAGKSIMRFYSRLDNLKITSKGFNDYVSEADQEAEKIITEVLIKAYPQYKITAEESGSNDINSEYEWFIDPLDGTTNFIHGIPQFAVSIGLCKNKIPIIGVVYDPFKNELFCAEKGKGALMNNKKIRVSKCNSIKSAIFGTGIPYRKKDHSGVYIETLRTLMDAKCGSIRRLGAAALDLAYVASGRLDGFWEFNLQPWDIAAGSIIVLEAGGYISDINGTEDYLENGNVLAANMSLHKDIIDNLKEKNIKI